MENHFALIALGGLLLAGLVADELGRRTRLPRVSLLVLCGVIAGPSGADLIPAALTAWYEFLATIALTMVAFLLGGTLSRKTLSEHGKAILLISAAVVIATIIIMSAGLALIGAPLVLCLLLAGIATATDPAAINDVVAQTGAKGPFSDILKGVVAVDDAWGIVAFSLLLVVAKAIAGDGALQALIHGLRELVGAIALGTVIGLPAAYLTGRLQPGEPTQAEALGIVFICAGLAVWLNVSFLLAGIVTGAIIANLARHHDRPFHEIEHVEWPFMVLFFVLAGATFDAAGVALIGWLGAAFFALRIAARIAGGWLGAASAGTPETYRRWIGLALTPQAGVAVGMALVAGNHFPELRETLIAITITTTLAFELAGPLLCLLALRKIGEDKPQ
jgi:Kef-type K+ transport system membrane component KefB